jgi:hypothetical protein
MLSLFRRKKRTDLKTEVALMKKIFGGLGGFDRIRDQLDEGILIGSRLEDKPLPYYLKFSHETRLLNKYEDRHGRYYAIKG